MEKKVVKMEKILVKMEKVEKMEKILAILEKIIVMIPFPSLPCGGGRAPLRWRQRSRCKCGWG
jgi:hypothetical protein